MLVGIRSTWLLPLKISAFTLAGSVCITLFILTSCDCALCSAGGNANLNSGVTDPNTSEVSGGVPKSVEKNKTGTNWKKHKKVRLFSVLFLILVFSFK